jgi:predicted GNAT superfamily acetyltransferase
MQGLEKILERKGKRFLFEVEDSKRQEDYTKYEDLRNKIWDWPADHMAGPRGMMCENFFNDGGSLFIAVYSESGPGKFDDLVGFAYGFAGVKNKQLGYRTLDNLQFYSQYTAVKPGFEQFGLGIDIKEFQKEAVVDLMGIYTVTCTYDPLTGINAYRNIHRLGMEVIEYTVDIYGEFGGRLNRTDVPRDRLAMTWELKNQLKRQPYDLMGLIEKQRVVTEVEPVEVRGKSGTVELETLRGVDLDLDQEWLLLEIPFDFYRTLQETDVDDPDIRQIPLTWRMRTREIFLSLLERDFSVYDFRHVEIEGRKRDFYVFKKNPVS